MGNEINDDDKPFGNSFAKPLLEEETVSREYARTGSPIKTDSKEVEQPVIDRVEFNFDQFEQLAETQAAAAQAAAEDEDEEDASEISQTEHNDGLDPSEVALNKKVQAKIAKSQSKNIVGMYVMLLRAIWKWIGKVDEQKLTMMHAKRQIDINAIIQNHPLIYHIKQMNEDVDSWEIDEDQEEAIEEALEIYMVSKNIQTSPGMNLAMAMGVPAVEMIGRALSHKKSIKTLISSVQEMQKQAMKRESTSFNSQNNQIKDLQDQLEQERESNRNKQLMETIVTEKSEKVAPPKTPTGGRNVRKNERSKEITVKSNKPAVSIEKKETVKTEK